MRLRVDRAFLVVLARVSAAAAAAAGALAWESPKSSKFTLLHNVTSVQQHPPHTPTMFGPFRFTNPLSGGLLWKIPYRLSKFQKRRHRLRLRHVDGVVATLDKALAKQGKTLPSVERWKTEMPTEEMMVAKDKYTMFDRKEKRYRKGIHSMFLPWFLGLGKARELDY